MGGFSGAGLQEAGPYLLGGREAGKGAEVGVCDQHGLRKQACVRVLGHLRLVAVQGWEEKAQIAVTPWTLSQRPQAWVGMRLDEHPDGQCSFQSQKEEQPREGPASTPAHFMLLGFLSLFPQLPQVEHNPSYVDAKASSRCAAYGWCIRHTTHGSCCTKCRGCHRTERRNSPVLGSVSDARQRNQSSEH